MATVRIFAMILMAWCSAALIGWYMRRAYRRGVIRDGFFRPRLATEPGSFWFAMSLYGVCGIAIAIVAMYFTTLIPQALSPECRAAARPLDCLE